MKAKVLAESSVLYFIFSPGSLCYGDVYRCESGRYLTLPFFLTTSAHCFPQCPILRKTQQINEFHCNWLCYLIMKMPVHIYFHALIFIVGNSWFATRKTLSHHMKSLHVTFRMCYPCPCCKSTFSNTWSVYRHLYKGKFDVCFRYIKSLKNKYNIRRTWLRIK